MRSNAGLLSFALAALSPFTAMAQPLLGLSLGPRLITVAEVWHNRSSGPIVQIEGSAAYQAALAGIARKEPPERLVHHSCSLSWMARPRTRGVLGSQSKWQHAIEGAFPSHGRALL